MIDRLFLVRTHDGRQLPSVSEHPVIQVLCYRCNVHTVLDKTERDRLTCVACGTSLAFHLPLGGTAVGVIYPEEVAEIREVRRPGS